MLLSFLTLVFSGDHQKPQPQPTVTPVVRQHLGTVKNQPPQWGEQFNKDFSAFEQAVLLGSR